MMPEHTAKAFDADLQELTRMVAEMGGLAEKEIADSVDAIAKRDSDLGKRVVADDERIDALQREVRNLREMISGLAPEIQESPDE